MEFIMSLEMLINNLKDLTQFYSLGFITEKEYYKIRHRILDRISSSSEEEQKLCEQEINKL